MRRFSWVPILGGLGGLLTLAFTGVAGASAAPPIVQPRITSVISSALCPATVCQLEATLTYDTPVGIVGTTPNGVAAAFTVEDSTNGQTCRVLSVTTIPTPTAIPPIPSNLLYLRASCLVRPGDAMLLLYRQTPNGWVYNASAPQVHALSPQAVSWIEGPGVPGLPGGSVAS